MGFAENLKQIRKEPVAGGIGRTSECKSPVHFKMGTGNGIPRGGKTTVVFKAAESVTGCFDGFGNC